MFFVFTLDVDIRKCRYKTKYNNNNKTLLGINIWAAADNILVADIRASPTVTRVRKTGQTIVHKGYDSERAVSNATVRALVGPKTLYKK